MLPPATRPTTVCYVVTLRALGEEPRTREVTIPGNMVHPEGFAMLAAAEEAIEAWGEDWYAWEAREVR